MQASSIAIMAAGVMPCMRIMARIIVLHMSAQFMHAGAQSNIWVEHTVQACSQAAHASMTCCIMAMSISGMPSIAIMSADMAFITMASIPRLLIRVTGRMPACRHARTAVPLTPEMGTLDRVTSSAINTRRTRLRTLLAMLLGLALAAVASPAFAHDELIGTDPARDATVAALPEQLTLTFSGVILDDAGATSIVVVDSACTDLVAGDPVLDGTKVMQPVTAGADGVVTVQWRVVSSDGHPISGEYAFTVGEGGSGEPCAAAPDEQADAGSSPWVIVFAVLGVIAVGVGGALLYVMITRLRARRED